MSGAEIWNHIIATLKVVLWPAVAVWAFFVLKNSIKNRMDDLESLDVRGIIARFSRKKLDVASEVGQILSKTAEIEATASNDGSEDKVESLDLLSVREDIETIIERSFSAGVQASLTVGVGTEGGPEPEITWVGSQPKVGFKMGAGTRTPNYFQPAAPNYFQPAGPNYLSVTPSNWRAALRRRMDRRDAADRAQPLTTDVMAHMLVRNFDSLKDLSTDEQLANIREVASLETEMKDLALSIANRRGIDRLDPMSSELSADRHLWSELQLKLRTLDPTSPWGQLDLAEVASIGKPRD
ncbi:hypothetical protein OG558_12690 [Kribbella sp. NBC_01510]|uniref:hypothetical protein n=1 Tax=Kribbella sp. NBC_01510 TaxID=2903581 RepID=UPI00386DAB4F